MTPDHAPALPSGGCVERAIAAREAGRALVKSVTLNGISFLIEEDDWLRLKHKPWRAVRNQFGRVSVTRQEGTRPNVRNIYIQHEIVGHVPADQVVDHINLDPSDNRRSNLRVCTVRQNLMNKGPQSNNRLGLKGVSRTPHGRYAARLRVAGQPERLGTFATPQEAAAAYDAAAFAAFGQFAWLNASHHDLPKAKETPDHGCR